jgi:hypothetical protein
MAVAVDLKKLESLPHVLDVHELVGVWTFWIAVCPVNPIEVKVWKDSKGLYTGLTNYVIKNTNQTSSHRTLHSASTVQEAIVLAMSEILDNFNPEFASSTRFIKAEEKVRF